MNLIRLALMMVTVILLSALTAGCGPHYFYGKTAPDIRHYSIKRVALLPFETESAKLNLFENGKGKDMVLKTGKIEPPGQEVLTQVFRDLLEKKGNFSVVSQAEVVGTLVEIDQNIPDPAAADKIVQIGEKLNVDAVLIGSILAYEERKGGPFGVERPATVGFMIRLIGIPDGKTLWTGSYFERQQALTENIAIFPLFWKRDGRWLTAKELAEYGAEQALTDMLPISEGTPS